MKQVSISCNRPRAQPPTHSPSTPPTLPQPKDRNTYNTPLVPIGLVKPKSNPLIHSPHQSRPSTLFHSTSDALDTTPQPRIPPTCSAFTTTRPHQSLTQTLPSPSHPHSLSIHTCDTNNIIHTPQSHINYRIHIGYHDNLTDRPKTTT